MYKRYGYSFKNDRKGSDSSIDLRFIVGFIGLFIVIPLIFIGWLFTSPEPDGNTIRGLYEAIPLITLALTLLICPLLGYLAVEFPVFGYKTILVFAVIAASGCFTSILLSLFTGGLFVLYQSCLIVLYELLIAQTALHQLRAANAANKAQKVEA